jgi:type IV pilus assembly protein PilC
MANYTYEAVNALGARTAGMLDVTDQTEALQRIREMGLFPMKVVEDRRRRSAIPVEQPGASFWKRLGQASVPGFGSRPRPRALAVFTRQLATLLDAGMPLLRGLRTLQEQAESAVLKRILRDIGMSIESGASFSEALALHPKVFNPLYRNMARAGENEWSAGNHLAQAGRIHGEGAEDQRQSEGRHVLSGNRSRNCRRHHGGADGLCGSEVPGRL